MKRLALARHGRVFLLPLLLAAMIGAPTVGRTGTDGGPLADEIPGRVGDATVDAYEVGISELTYDIPGDSEAMRSFTGALAGLGLDPEDVEVAQGYLATEEAGDATISVFRAAGADGAALLDAIAPLFAHRMTDPVDSTEEIAGRTVRVLRSGSGDPGTSQMAALLADADLAWVASGSPALVSDIVEAIPGGGQGPDDQGPDDQGPDEQWSPFPPEIAGIPVKVQREDGVWLTSGWSDVPGGPEAVAALVSVLEARGLTLEDLEVARAILLNEFEGAFVTAYRAPGLTGDALLEGLQPLLQLEFEAPEVSTANVGGRLLMAIGEADSDPTDLGTLFLHPDADALLTIRASAGLRDDIVSQLVSGTGSGVVEPPESAVDLILADVDAGLIDEQTGLTYRVWAQHGDPGLPEQYRALPAEEDLAALDVYALEHGELRPEVAEAVLPYLVRPTDPRSVLHGEGVGAAGGGLLATIGAGVAVEAPRTAQGACGPDGWARTASTTIPVVAWALCTTDPAGAARAETLSLLEGLYPDMVGLMGHPKPDTGGDMAGGDKAIDIYLVDAEQCISPRGRCVVFGGDTAALAYKAAPWEGPAGAQSSSGYMVASLERAGPSVAFLADLAHEFFHILQYAHNARGIVVNGASYWFTEASAKWAEHSFVPEGRPTEVHPWFVEFERAGRGLSDPTYPNPYRSYAWPLFMEQEKGAEAIAAAWRAFEGKQGSAALDDALSGVVSFDDRFGDFAVRAWNGPLPADDGGDAVEPRFQALDPGLPTVTPGPNRHAIGSLEPIDREAPSIEVPLDIPPLGIRYHEYRVSEDTAQLTIDLSGVASAETNSFDVLLHVAEEGWTRRTLDPGETRLCFSTPETRVDQLILVIGRRATTGATIGRFTLRPLTDPCELGNYTIVLEGWRDGGEPMPANGTWKGEALIDCYRFPNGDWHIFLGAADDPATTVFQHTIYLEGANREVKLLHDLDHQDTVWWLRTVDGATIRAAVNEQADPVTVTVDASGRLATWDERIQSTLACSGVYEVGG